VEGFYGEHALDSKVGKEVEHREDIIVDSKEHS